MWNLYVTSGATFSIQPTYVGRILSLAFILNLYLIGQAYDVSAHEIVHIVMNVVLVFSLITFIHLFLIQAGLHPRICEIFYSYVLLLFSFLFLIMNCIDVF